MEHTTAALTAAAIRKELKQKFATIKFKVTSDNFANGNSVKISYTDAVPETEVEEITRKYQYGHFDGMIDLYEHSNSRDDIPQAKYVTVNRQMSQQAQEQIKKGLMSELGITEAEWNDPTTFFNRFNCWNDQLIYRTFIEKTFKEVI